ncbi:MAG: PLP-dependent aminotransferase family protein [Herpetosiphon sp.]
MTLSEQPINFTRGVPAVESFSVEEIADCAAAVVRGPHSSEVLQYGSSMGFTPLRELLAERHTVTADQVMVANGSLQFLDFLGMSVLKPGDLVFVESPTYDRALTLFRRHGMRITGIPMQSDGPDLDALEAALRDEVPRLMYIIADFQNPSGVTASGAKRGRIVELARQYGFLLLEDAPYRQLRYRGTQEPTLFELAPEQTLHMSSFAKQICPGVRIGYMIADQQYLKQIARVAEDTYITPNPLGCATVYEYCRRGLLDGQLQRLRELYGERLQAVAAAIHEYLPAASWVEPDGGFFLSLNLPAGMTSQNLIREAARLKLSLSDGRGFFPNPSDGERFLRLPFCALTPAMLREGVRRVALAVEQASSEPLVVR